MSSHEQLMFAATSQTEEEEEAGHNAAVFLQFENPTPQMMTVFLSTFITTNRLIREVVMHDCFYA